MGKNNVVRLVLTIDNKEVEIVRFLVDNDKKEKQYEKIEKRVKEVVKGDKMLNSQGEDCQMLH